MSMSVLVFLLTVSFGIFSMFIGMCGATIVSNSKQNLPKSYRIMYLSAFIGLLFFAILLSLKIGYDFSYEGEILVALVLINVPLVIYVFSSRTSKGRKSVAFKNVFFKYKVTEEDLAYQKLTSKEFAEENGIEFIPSVVKKRLSSMEKKKKYVAMDNRCISLYPYKHGNSITPIEWYGENEKGEYFLILSNKNCFEGITNLDDILFDIIRLYSKYIGDDVFIDFSGFAIKLQDEVTKNYKGRASLVVTEELIQNDRIEYEDRYNAKSYYVKIFLTHFIGWNFGRHARQSTSLKVALYELRKLIAKEGL